MIPANLTFYCWRDYEQKCVCVVGRDRLTGEQMTIDELKVYLEKKLNE